MYKYIIKPFFFLFDPEKVHYFAMDSLAILVRIPIVNLLIKKFCSFEHPALVREVFGLEFKNPIGLAAGFDKNGKYIEALSYLGFGFVEVGTVTPYAQKGNPKPRIFRLPKDEALINRLGFNNDGLDKLVKRLKSAKRNGMIIGGNIGKNKVTPNENAVYDYVKCFQELYPYVDYFVVNVSSPNTPNLRELQEKEPLRRLLSELMTENKQRAIQKPILLKIAPDLTEEQLVDIVEIVKETKISGIVTNNTTVSRENLLTQKIEIEKIGVGGLSGRPVKEKSQQVMNSIISKAPDLELIGVGGIFTGSDALERLNAGCKLIQIYTGFVYEGPTIVKKINEYLISNGYT